MQLEFMGGELLGELRDDECMVIVASHNVPVLQNLRAYYYWLRMSLAILSSLGLLE